MISLWQMTDTQMKKVCVKKVYVLLQNHRMLWGGRDIKDDLVTTLCHEQGHLPLSQIAQGSIQPGLGTLPRWDIHHVSGQPVPVFYQSHSKEYLL